MAARRQNRFVVVIINYCVNLFDDDYSSVVKVEAAAVAGEYFVGTRTYYDAAK